MSGDAGLTMEPPAPQPSMYDSWGGYIRILPYAIGAWLVTVAIVVVVFSL